MVHHGSLDARRRRAPRARRRSTGRRSARWLRRAYARVDAVMSACDPRGRHRSRGDAAAALRPRRRVLSRRATSSAATTCSTPAGSAREKGVFELLEAAALRAEPWPLWLMGTGTRRARGRRRAIRRLGLGDRVRIVPTSATARRSPRAYRSARCVVMPGELETFGLVAFEAAASRRVDRGLHDRAVRAAARRRSPTPSRPATRARCWHAIERARAREPDRLAAARFAAANRWERAFAAELADLEALVAQRRAV